MTSPSPDKLTPAELASLRARAAAGEIPTLEICRLFIASIRKSWLAKPDAQTKGKSRTKKVIPDENQIDFF